MHWRQPDRYVRACWSARWVGRLGRGLSVRLAIILAMLLTSLTGCRPSYYRKEADRAATGIIERTRLETFGYDGSLDIEPSINTLRRQLMQEQDLPRSGAASLGSDQLEPLKHWPEKDYPPRGGAEELALDIELADAPFAEVCHLTLIEALQIAAKNSRDYQSRKEDVYRTALDLELEDDDFRNTFAGAVDSLYTYDMAKGAHRRGIETAVDFDWRKRLKTGADISAGLAIDLVKLLSADRDAAFGILADMTISVPLMRGAGRYIVTEPLTQAQRDVIYALYSFERYKRTLAVRVASDYLSVLRQQDEVENELNNFERLLQGTRRTNRLSEAGRLPEMQVDQARQDALRARDRWIAAEQTYAQRLDQFKITLGLPTDATIELDETELLDLAETARYRMPDESIENQPVYEGAVDDPIEIVAPTAEGGGPLELPPEEAIQIALENRLDLQTTLGRVFDSQRRVIVRANALEMGLALTGGGRFGEGRSLGSAGLRDGRLEPQHGIYTFGLLLDLPLERTAEQNAYRDSYISLERSVRDVQELEDQIKLEIRGELRNLLRARESYRIQALAVKLANRRVESTSLLLDAGRAEVRDVLEAQEAFVQAQNALTLALVNYRIAELELQRDMGVLQVDDEGLWHEYEPAIAETE